MISTCCVFKFIEMISSVTIACIQTHNLLFLNSLLPCTLHYTNYLHVFLINLSPILISFGSCSAGEEAPREGPEAPVPLHRGNLHPENLHP